MNFVFAQPSCLTKKYKWNFQQKQDTQMKKEASKPCQMKVAKMSYDILPKKKKRVNGMSIPNK